MTNALLVSNVLLWMLVVGLGLVVVALARQIGLLHERIAPVGALAHRRNPEVGDTTSGIELTDLDGRRVTIGGAGERTLLFFVSPSCPICKTLLPTVRRVLSEESPPARLVLASDGDRTEHDGFRREQGLEDETYVLSTELGIRFGVAKLPTAILLDERGVIRARGLVNTREHVESLFEADRHGVGSLQDFLARERGVDSLSNVEARS